MADQDTIRIIAFRECDQWVAQCLEYDVCVQASDLDTLSLRMETALMAEHECLAERGGITTLPQAPDRFFQMWDHRSEFDRAGAVDGVNYELALCA